MIASGEEGRGDECGKTTETRRAWRDTEGVELTKVFTFAQPIGSIPMSNPANSAGCGVVIYLVRNIIQKSIFADENSRNIIVVSHRKKKSRVSFLNWFWLIGLPPLNSSALARRGWFPAGFFFAGKLPRMHEWHELREWRIDEFLTT
jgi:hypothetical protein